MQGGLLRHGREQHDPTYPCLLAPLASRRRSILLQHKTVSVFWPLSRSPRGVNRRSGSSVTDIVLCARRVVHLFTLHLGHFPGVLLFVWPIRYHRRRKKRLNSHWGWVRFSALIFRTNGKGASKSKQRHFRKAPDQISPKNASFARYWRELFPFSKNRAL